MKKTLFLAVLMSCIFGSAHAASYTELSTSWCDSDNNVIYDGKGYFRVESASSTSVELTINLESLVSYVNSNDYVSGKYMLLWDANEADYGFADNADTSVDNGSREPYLSGYWAGAAWNATTNNISYDKLSEYATDGSITLYITNSSTNGVTVSTKNSAGTSVSLYSASGLKSSNNTSIQGYYVNLNYVTAVTLNTVSTLDTSTYVPPVDYSTPFVSERTDGTTVGRITFLGDSITHGVNDASYRWQIFKIFTDNGIENEIAGPREGYYSTPSHTEDAGTGYGGAEFSNTHLAQASGRTHNIISGSTSISLNGTNYTSGVNYGGHSTSTTADSYDSNTWFCMMGTNDLLSDTPNSGPSTEQYATQMQKCFGGSVAYNAATDSYVWEAGSSWGTMATIVDDVCKGNDTFYMLSITPWGEHSNHNRDMDHYAGAEFNRNLQAWCEAYATETGKNVVFVDVTRGMVDPTSDKRFTGHNDFFNSSSDRLHPNDQGSLIMAGNLAQAMGIGGRTAGLERQGADTWEHASPGTVSNGATEILLAENAFTMSNGYTVDLTAAYGNGATDGWLTSDQNLAITLGDGTNCGTLNISEGHIKWGEEILFCWDNSTLIQEGNLRIAWHNGNAADNVLDGYYVWLGDMLIGQGLAAADSDIILNGILISSTGADAIVSNVAWANTAYAPSTEGLVSTQNAYTSTQDAASVTQLVSNKYIPLAPLPDELRNALPTTSGVDYTNGTVMALTGNPMLVSSAIAEDSIFKITSAASWFGMTNNKPTGSVCLQLTGATGATIFGAMNSQADAAALILEIEAGSRVADGTYSGQTAAIAGSYGNGHADSFSVYLNGGTVSGDIVGGSINNNGRIGNVLIVINDGTAEANILGGAKISGASVGAATIEINGGLIKGNIEAGGRAGSVGNTTVTVKGGIIEGNITKGTATYTDAARASVIIDGTKAFIAGDITADDVTLKNITSTEYKDTFDKYSGSITADTLTLENVSSLIYADIQNAANVNLTEGTETGIKLAAANINLQKLNLSEGTSFSVAATESGTATIATLSGNGTLIADGKLLTISAFDSWAGTVKLANITNLTNFNPDTYVSDSSTLELSGITGYLQAANSGSGKAYTANLKLTDTEGSKAVTINNGWTNDKNTFNGSICGDGSFVHKATGPNNTTFTFAGDLSNWTGAFVEESSGKNTSLVINSTGTKGDSIIAAGIERKAGTLNVAFSGSVEAEMKGNISADLLTIANKTAFSGSVAVSALTANADTVFSGALSVSSTLTNNAAMSMEQDSVTLAAQLAGTGTIEANALTLQGATNSIGSLIVTNDMTLDTQVTGLTATTLGIGGDVIVKNLTSNMFNIGGLTDGSTLRLNISDKVLRDSLINSNLTSMVLGTVIGDVELLGDWTTGQYLYTLTHDSATGALSIGVSINGNTWGGAAGDEDTNWNSNMNWQTSTGEQAVVPSETASVIFSGLGSSSVVFTAEEKASSISINVADTEGLIKAYTFTGTGSSTTVSLHLVDNLTIQGATLTTDMAIVVDDYTEVLDKGNLIIKAGGSVVSRYNMLNIGQITVEQFGLLNVTNEGQREEGSLVNRGTITSYGQVTIGPSGTMTGMLAEDDDASSTLVPVDMINSGTYTNNGSLAIMGNLINSGSLSSSGIFSLTGNTDNSGTINITTGVANIGGTVDPETGAVTSVLTNSGVLNIGGVPNPDATHDGAKQSAVVTVLGNLNNNGELNIIDEGSLTVNGHLLHSGEGTITVEAGSSLNVTGNLHAADMTLDFDGEVTIGGTAIVNTLTINEQAIFTAHDAQIGTLVNNGTLSVGEMNAAGELQGGTLVLDTLSGTCDVNIGKDGRITIKVDGTKFTGKLNNLGSLIFENEEETPVDVELLGAQEFGATAGNITTDSLTIGEEAVGTAADDSATTLSMGHIVTDTLTISGLDAAGSAARIEMASLSCKEENGKVKIILTDIEDSSITQESSFHLIALEKAVTGSISDNFDLSNYGYNTNGQYVADSASVQTKYMQNLLRKGLMIRFADTAPAAVLAAQAGDTSDLFAMITEQTTEEATWNTNKNISEVGLNIGTLDKGTIQLLSNDILDKVKRVSVTQDTVIDLTPDNARTAPLNIHGLSGNRNLTINGNGDKVYVDDVIATPSGNTLGDFSGVLTLHDVDATLNLHDRTVLITGGGELSGTMSGGVLALSGNASATGKGLVLDGTSIALSLKDGLSPDMLNGKLQSVEIYQLGNVTGTTAGIYVLDEETLSVPATFTKYFDIKSLRLENGAIVGDRNTSYYSSGLAAESENGKAGLSLADNVLVESPVLPEHSELAEVLSALDAPQSRRTIDKLGAALAGAGTAVLGQAVSGDIDRQLKTIRNRTTTMGVDQEQWAETQTTFNAWINAEGDSSELYETDSAAGYKLNSWGGTVGVDVDLSPTITAGLALTAMHGDLEVTSADNANGSIDTSYISAFARYCDSAWTHTFVGTFGMSDISLDRNVNGFQTKGETNGSSFGLMYELGYVFVLDEYNTTCLQPIINVVWSHSEIDAYTETGSDLALNVGKQTMDSLTFGLGARLQSIVGENAFNRTSIFECRVLTKFNAGDRQSKAKVAIAATNRKSAEVESAEAGAFGIELGAGFTLPLEDNHSSIFIDASCELRADYTDANATLGYRVNF